MIAALYHINQCALYKVGSKAKLAQILGISVASLLAIVKKPRYREFLLPEEVCPFTGKITKERWVQEPLGELRAIHERLPYQAEIRDGGSAQMLLVGLAELLGVVDRELPILSSRTSPRLLRSTS